MPALTHIALHVRDGAACCEFYQRVAGMQVVHERDSKGTAVTWLALPGQEKDFVLVIFPGGPGRNQAADDYSHLGFALDSREQVDAVAGRARERGELVWEPKDEPWPVGYYCGIRDPDGNFVEFSFGQPLGPGSQEH